MSTRLDNPELEARIRQWVWGKADHNEEKELQELCNSDQDALQYLETIRLWYPTEAEWTAFDLTEKQNNEILDFINQLQNPPFPACGQLWSVSDDGVNVLIVSKPPTQESHLWRVVPYSDNLSLVSQGDIFWLKKHENRSSLVFHPSAAGIAADLQFSWFKGTVPDEIWKGISSASYTLRLTSHETYLVQAEAEDVDDEAESGLYLEDVRDYMHRLSFRALAWEEKQLSVRPDFSDLKTEFGIISGFRAVAAFLASSSHHFIENKTQLFNEWFNGRKDPIILVSDEDLQIKLDLSGSFPEFRIQFGNHDISLIPRISIETQWGEQFELKDIKMKGLSFSVSYGELLSLKAILYAPFRIRIKLPTGKEIVRYFKLIA